MSFTPPEADPAAWLAKAEGDLEAAERIGAVAHLAWIAGFHLQQAAEKALKAVLVAHGSFPPKTHDLKMLADEATRLVPSLAGWDARLVPLNEYSVLERYPTSTVMSLDLARFASEARALLGAVRSAIPAPSR